METNTNIKYTPSERELYKIELAAERINALLKTLDTTDGNNKTLEDLNAIIETIKDWDNSDDSLGVKEQLLNIYNSMLSEDEFNKLYLPEIDENITNVNERVDELETQIGDISSVLDSIQTGLDETLELQNAYISGGVIHKITITSEVSLWQASLKRAIVDVDGTEYISNGGEVYVSDGTVIKCTVRGDVSTGANDSGTGRIIINGEEVVSAYGCRKIYDYVVKGDATIHIEDNSGGLFVASGGTITITE